MSRAREAALAACGAPPRIALPPSLRPPPRPAVAAQTSARTRRRRDLRGRRLRWLLRQALPRSPPPRPPPGLELPIESYSVVDMGSYVSNHTMEPEQVPLPGEHRAAPGQLRELHPRSDAAPLPGLQGHKKKTLPTSAYQHTQQKHKNGEAQQCKTTITVELFPLSRMPAAENGSMECRAKQENKQLRKLLAHLTLYLKLPLHLGYKYAYRKTILLHRFALSTRRRRPSTRSGSTTFSTS